MSIPTTFIILPSIVLTASLDIDYAGAVCTFTGSIDGRTLALTMTECTAPRIVSVPCASGALRDLLPRTATLRATVDADRITGDIDAHEAVLESATRTEAGAFAGRSSFILTRQ